MTAGTGNHTLFIDAIPIAALQTMTGPLGRNCRTLAANKTGFNFHEGTLQWRRLEQIGGYLKEFLQKLPQGFVGGRSIWIASLVPCQH